MYCRLRALCIFIWRSLRRHRFVAFSYLIGGYEKYAVGLFLEGTGCLDERKQIQGAWEIFVGY